MGKYHSANPQLGFLFPEIGVEPGFQTGPYPHLKVGNDEIDTKTDFLNDIFPARHIEPSDSVVPNGIGQLSGDRDFGNPGLKYWINVSVIADQHAGSYRENQRHCPYIDVRSGVEIPSRAVKKQLHAQLLEFYRPGFQHRRAHRAENTPMDEVKIKLHGRHPPRSLHTIFGKGVYRHFVLDGFHGLHSNQFCFVPGFIFYIDAHRTIDESVQLHQRPHRIVVDLVNDIHTLPNQSPSAGYIFHNLTSVPSHGEFLIVEVIRLVDLFFNAITQARQTRITEDLIPDNGCHILSFLVVVPYHYFQLPFHELGTRFGFICNKALQLSSDRAAVPGKGYLSYDSKAFRFDYLRAFARNSPESGPAISRKFKIKRLYHQAVPGSRSRPVR